MALAMDALADPKLTVVLGGNRERLQKRWWPTDIKRVSKLGDGIRWVIRMEAKRK